MKKLNILIPFSAPLDNVCDYAKQTIQLLSRQHNVVGLAVSDPISLFRDFASVLRGEFYIPHWNTHILRPVMVIPFQRFDFIKRLNFNLNIFVINIWFGRKDGKKILWFFEPHYLRQFLKFFKYDLSIYDCVDYFPAYERWQAEHDFCLKQASKVVVNSHTLKDEFKESRSDIKVVPLGFSLSEMSDIKTAKKHLQKTLVLGYVGTVGDRLDLDFLQTLIKKRPDDKLVFIGPQSFDPEIPKSKEKQEKFQKLILNKKVIWIDQLSRQEAWREAGKFDVGLIPYDAKDLFNRYSFPMKTMEYFYVGLPIITTEVKELARYNKVIYQPETQGWAGLNAFIKKQQSERNKKLLHNISLQHTWEKKINKILELLPG